MPGVPVGTKCLSTCDGGSLLARQKAPWWLVVELRWREKGSLQGATVSVVESVFLHVSTQLHAVILE